MKGSLSNSSCTAKNVRMAPTSVQAIIDKSSAVSFAATTIQEEISLALHLLTEYVFHAKNIIIYTLYVAVMLSCIVYVIASGLQSKRTLIGITIFTSLLILALAGISCLAMALLVSESNSVHLCINYWH